MKTSEYAVLDATALAEMIQNKEVTAEEVLEALRVKTWSQPVREMLDTISALLLHSDFDAIIDIVNEFTEI